MQENIFSKVENLLKAVNKKLPRATRHDCRRYASKLSNHYKYLPRNQRKKLSREEVIFYDLLLDLEISPATAYRWLLLYDAPQDLQEQLRQNKISIKDAFKEIRWRSKCRGPVYPSKKCYHEMNISAFHLFIDDRIGNP